MTPSSSTLTQIALQASREIHHKQFTKNFPGNSLDNEEAHAPSLLSLRDIIHHDGSNTRAAVTHKVIDSVPTIIVVAKGTEFEKIKKYMTLLSETHTDDDKTKKSKSLTVKSVMRILDHASTNEEKGLVDGLKDLLVDGLCIPTDHAPSQSAKMKVHLGFLSADQKVINPVLLKVNDLLASNTFQTASLIRIMLCGHSLGGALAHIFLLLLHDKLGVAVQERLSWNLITFGAPHVGCVKFCSYLSTVIRSKSDGRCCRFASKYDPIPKLLNVIPVYTHMTTDFELQETLLGAGLELASHSLNIQKGELSINTVVSSMSKFALRAHSLKYYE